MSEKLITIGIPAYKAEKTLPTLLASVQIQTFVDKCKVIIANDWPEDNEKYEFVKDLYPDLDITILDCGKNTGPGLSRQRALDACETEWITFIDADDIFIGPFAIENLLNNTTPNCVEVMGTFYQEITEGCMSAAERLQLMSSGQSIPPRLMPRNDVGHPWVFARLYRATHLKQNGIGFSDLRAMED